MQQCCLFLKNARCAGNKRFKSKQSKTNSYFMEAMFHCSAILHAYDDCTPSAPGFTSSGLHAHCFAPAAFKALQIIYTPL